MKAIAPKVGGKLSARLHHQRDRDGRCGVRKDALLPNVSGLKGRSAT
jgi:hypothetical protein